MLRDYFNLAITSIKYRKLRSWLTIIGIVIGIAAIISLITVSQGLENAMTEQLEQFGANRIYITPKLTGLTLGTGLTTDDVRTIEKISELDWIDPMIMTSDEAEFSREKQFIQQLIGMELENLEEIYGDVGLNLISGNYPRGKESNVLILGYRAAKDKFEKEVKLNNQIKIKDKKFKVIGVFEEIGNSDDDNMVIISIDDFRELYNKPDEVSAIQVKVKQGVDINFVAEKIQRKMEKARDNDSFMIMTPESLLRQLGSMLAVIQIVLGGIAAISLLVGGIGIMNSMYTSVLERTRQIGIMKSLGARNNHIFLIFVVEAGIIGAIGGIVGVILGSAISLAVGFIAEQSGFKLLKIIIDYRLLLFGLAFAFLMGAFSGYLPARRAAKMQPVEALRQ